MRKVVVSNIISLDGYFESPNLLDMPMDAFFDAQNLEHQRSATTLLLGAKTYMGLKSYWPPIAQDPTRSPAVQHDPSVADVHRETAVRNNELQKVVISDSITESDTAPWIDTTRIVRRSEAHQAVRELRHEDGGDILVFGSRTLWNDLLSVGLVDELHLMLGAAVVGDGTPAFSDAKPLHLGALTLVDVVRQEGSSNVLLQYAL